MIYRFGRCSFDTRTHELTRDAHPVPLQGKTADLLHYLLENPDRLVPKDELLIAVWGNAHLTDSAIGQAVLKVRKAIGDDDRSILRTVHGKGFRLAAAIDTCDDANGQRTIPVRRSVFLIPGVLLGTLLMVALGWWMVQEAPPVVSAGSMQTPGTTTWIIHPFGHDAEDETFDWMEAGLSNALSEIMRWSADHNVVDSPMDGEMEPIEELAFLGADYLVQTDIEHDSPNYRIRSRVFDTTGRVASIVLEGTDLSVLNRQLARRILDLASEELPLTPLATVFFADPLVMELYARAVSAETAGKSTEARELIEAAMTREPDNPALHLKMLELQLPTNGHAAVSREIDRLLGELAPIADGELRTRLLYRLGDLLWYAGDITRSRELLEEALAGSDPDANPAQHASILNSLAAVVQSSGDLDASWELASRALTRFRELGDEYQVSVTLTNLGYLADDAGRLDSARKLHSEALDIRSRYEVPELIAASQYAMARILRRSGEFESAGNLLAQSLAIVRVLGLSIDLFDNLEERAELERFRGDFETALATIDEARMVAEASEDTLGLGWAASVRGKILRDQAKYDESATAFEESLTLLTNANEDHEAAYIRVELAETAIRSGDLVGGRGLLGSVDTVVGENSSHNLAVRVTHLGALALEDTHARGVALEEAVREARAIGAHDLEAMAALDAGLVMIEQNRWEDARRMLSIAKKWNATFYKTQELETILASREPT